MKKSELRQMIKEALHDFSAAAGIPNVKKGDKYKVVKGYNNRPFKLNLGGYNNMLEVPKGAIIEFESERGNWDVKTFFIYKGKTGYLESPLKGILDYGAIK